MMESRQIRKYIKQKNEIRRVTSNPTVLAAGSTWRSSKKLLESLPESGRRTVNQLESKFMSDILVRLQSIATLSVIQGGSSRLEATPALPTLSQATESAHVAVLGPLAAAVHFIAQERKDHSPRSQSWTTERAKTLSEIQYVLENNALFSNENFPKLRDLVSAKIFTKVVHLPHIPTLVLALDFYNGPFRSWTHRHKIELYKNEIRGYWFCDPGTPTASQPGTIEVFADSPSAVSTDDDVLQDMDPWPIQDGQDPDLNPSANAEEVGVTLPGAQLDVDTAVSSTPFSQAETEGDSLHDWPMDG